MHENYVILDYLLRGRVTWTEAKTSFGSILLSINTAKWRHVNSIFKNHLRRFSACVHLILLINNCYLHCFCFLFYCYPRLRLEFSRKKATTNQWTIGFAPTSNIKGSVCTATVTAIDRSIIASKWTPFSMSRNNHLPCWSRRPTFFCLPINLVTVMDVERGVGRPSPGRRWR